MRDAIVFGRNRRGRPVKERRYSESFLFTLGLIFVIIYFTGLLYTSGSGGADTKTEAVAVFAETDETGRAETPRGNGIWDKLDRCFERVFGKEGGGDK